MGVSSRNDHLSVCRQRGSAAQKYLKELEEVFDLFVRDNLNDHWLLLDDSPDTKRRSKWSVQKSGSYGEKFAS